MSIVDSHTHSICVRVCFHRRTSLIKNRTGGIGRTRPVGSEWNKNFFVNTGVQPKIPRARKYRKKPVTCLLETNEM